MASSGELDSLGILPSPRPLECGCQELISSSIVTHYGWLRKRGLWNRVSLKLFNWPQAYVVVADKCIYIFQNEISKKPSQSVSLYGFNRIIRANDKHKEAIWAFKIEHVQTCIPSLYFAATSESEMMTWMKLIKKEMLVANNIIDRDSCAVDSQYGGSISSRQSGSSSDYNFIEASIYEVPVGSKAARPESTLEYQSGTFEDDSDDGFDDQLSSGSLHQEMAQREPLPLPLNVSLHQEMAQRKPLPLPTESDSSGYSFQQNVPCNKAIDPQEDYWASVYFNGDKFEASRIIDRIGDAGVFLVRKSDDGGNVLVLYSTSVKKYKIHHLVDGTHTLDSAKGPYFDTLEKLLYHYFIHDLPMGNQKLSIPYKLHDQFGS